MLRHDHALRDQVFWRVFEVEGGGEISLANIDKFSREEFNWHNTVVLLANEGTLERAARCAAAWRRSTGISPPIAPAGSRACMRPWRPRPKNGGGPAAAAPVPGFVDHRHCLAGRQAAGGPAQARPARRRALRASLRRRFSGPKAAALSVLRMLEALGARAAVESDAVAQALALGLGHPHADVQRAAVKALARLGREDLAHQQRDALAPAVAACCRTPGPGARQGKGWRRAAKPAFVQRASRRRPRCALDRRGCPGTLCRAAGSARRRAGVRAGAGLAGDVRAGGGHDRALAKRARHHERDEQHYAAALLLAAHDPASAFLPRKFWQNTRSRQVDGEWVRENVGEPKALPSAEETTMLPSFVTRLREVAGIVQGRASRRPLLATPTDTQGWVDADVLLARYEAGKESGAPFPVDLTQALLRVPPEQRARAWSRPPAARGRGSPTPCGSVAQPWVGNLEGRWLSAMGVWHEIKRAHGSAFGPQAALIPSGPLRYNDGASTPMRWSAPNSAWPIRRRLCR